jgi:hypothetical protein
MVDPRTPSLGIALDRAVVRAVINDPFSSGVSSEISSATRTATDLVVSQNESVLKLPMHPYRLVPPGEIGGLGGGGGVGGDGLLGSMYASYPSALGVSAVLKLVSLQSGSAVAECLTSKHAHLVACTAQSGCVSSKRSSVSRVVAITCQWHVAMWVCG